MDARLKKIAELIPDTCNTLADIGTDHGYLVAEMVEEGRISKAIAADISVGSLSKVKEEVARRNLQDKIETRLGNGMDVLQIQENIDVIVIAGMGGGLISEILEEGKSWIIKHNPLLILQPVQGSELLSAYLEESGYHLMQEVLVEENQKIYRIFKAMWTGQINGISHPWDHEVGILLSQSKDHLFQRYMGKKIEEIQQILMHLKTETTPKAIKKRKELGKKRSAFLEYMDKGCREKKESHLPGGKDYEP